MKSTILSQLDTLPYFTQASAQQLSGASAHDARVTLARWRAQGQVLRIKRGLYMTRTFCAIHHQQPDFVEMLSMIIQPHAYLSTTYVLQKHGVLTEGTYAITACSEKNTQLVQNTFGSFSYQHLKPSIFTGFQLRSRWGVVIQEATPAKALFDFFYLRPQPMDGDLVESLRLNLDHWSQLQRDEFLHWCEESRSRKMLRIARTIETYWRTR